MINLVTYALTTRTGFGVNFTKNCISIFSLSNVTLMTVRKTIQGNNNSTNSYVKAIGTLKKYLAITLKNTTNVKTIISVLDSITINFAILSMTSFTDRICPI